MEEWKNDRELRKNRREKEFKVNVIENKQETTNSQNNQENNMNKIESENNKPNEDITISQSNEKNNVKDHLDNDHQQTKQNFNHLSESLALGQS